LDAHCKPVSLPVNPPPHEEEPARPAAAYED